MMPPISFKGRCQFLIDTGDGTTECERMRGIDPTAAWFTRLVDGNCDFPDSRIEV